MKRFLNYSACITLIIVSAFGISACKNQEEEPKNDYITVTTTDTSFPESDVVYKNTDTFKLNYKGDNHYVAEGNASVMNEEQANTWGTIANSKYIVLSVKMGVDGKAIFGWRSSETQNTAFKEDEIDGTLIKRTTSEDAVKEFILAVSDGDTPRHPDMKIWRIEVTEKDATEAKAYTIDFSALY